MSTVFITGSSKGLGNGFANYFLQSNNNVIGFSRSEAPSLSENKHYSHHLADFSQLDSISTVISKAIEGITQIDTVILNAGILGDIQTMHDSSIEEMKKVMDTNLWANKVILDTLLHKNVTIKQVVAISSGASINGNKGWSGYSISKAALNMLIKLYASEYPSTHFTALAPGLIDTSMQDYLCGKVDKTLFPSVERLQSARGTEAMPNGTQAAIQIASVFPKLLECPSGSYEDVRKL